MINRVENDGIVLHIYVNFRGKFHSMKSGAENRDKNLAKPHKISDFWPKSLAFSEKIWYNIEWKVPLKNAPKGGAHVPRFSR